MNRWMRGAAVAAMVIGVSCGSAFKQTPVTPAPLAEDKVIELKAALLGSWKLVDDQAEGGPRKKFDDTATMTFNADGTMIYRYAQGVNVLTLGGSRERKHGFKLEGANIVFDPPFFTMRVDKWSPTLELFVYDMSYHWYFERMPQKSASLEPQR